MTEITDSDGHHEGTGASASSGGGEEVPATVPHELDQEGKEKRKPEPPVPIGLIVSFLSGFLLLVFTGVVRYAHPRIAEVVTGSAGLDTWLIIWILVILARHQLRIVFIDSSEASRLHPFWKKAAVIALVPLALLGGIMWLFFGIHELFGAIVMLLYSIGFAAFWFFVVKGQKLSTDVVLRESQQYIPLIADLGLIVFWGYYVEGFDQGQPPNADELWVIALVVVFSISHEIFTVHKEPFMDRLRTCGQYIFGHAS